MTIHLLACVLALFAQAFSSAQLESAIAAGRAKQPGGIRLKARSYTVLVRGPLGRVTDLAREHADKLLPPLQPEAIEAKHLMPLLEVFVQPNPPVFSAGRWWVPPAVTHVVLRAKGSASAVQPTAVIVTPVAWANALGGKFESAGATASFNQADLPAGELEIVIPVPGHDPSVATLKVKDRDKIR